MKPEWEKRMLHHRAYTDSIYEMHGKTPPQHPKSGGAALPQWMKMSFNGPKFWPQFNERGHTKGHFEDCACRFRRDD
jgi:hypothetical protein